MFFFLDAILVWRKALILVIKRVHYQSVQKMEKHTVTDLYCTYCTVGYCVISIPVTWHWIGLHLHTVAQTYHLRLPIWNHFLYTRYCSVGLLFQNASRNIQVVTILYICKRTVNECGDCLKIKINCNFQNLKEKNLKKTVHPQESVVITISC